MSVGRTKLFVEAIPLVEERPSGIGHSLAGLVTALVRNAAFQERYEIVLVVPKRALHRLDVWPELKSCSRKGLPIRMRILNGLMKFHLLPPMDLLLGRGVYLFGNFKNWPISKKSVSYTYVHDICFALHPDFVAPKNQRMLAKNVPRFMSQSDYVITVSKSSRREIIDYYRLPDEKVKVLYNGVDAVLFSRYSPAEVSAVMKCYGITRPYIIFIGNIEPRKNLQRLVEAFAALPPTHTLLLVGGSGWLNEGVFQAIETARAAGASIIKPSTYVSDEDVAVLVSGAVALAHPALHEGFGMPPLEAMAASTPVVVADIPSLREVVGDAGVYCDPNDRSSITESLARVIGLSGNERKHLTQIGTKRSQQFSWANTAQDFYELLQKID